VAWALGGVLGRPFGFTCHAHDIFIERQLLPRKIEEAALAVTISRFNVEWLCAHATPLAARKLKVVHCGVDLARMPWQPDGREPRGILAVGRLDPIKGFDTLIEALALLRARGVDFHCRVIGAGPLGAELRALAARRGLAAQVEFAGPQTQDVVRAWMRSATLFALPSQVAADGNRDGIPVALMEAMASGCPVVSTRVSGIPELIADTEHGMLVEPRDPVALAAALQRLLADPALRQRLATGARAQVERGFDARKEAARLHGYMTAAVHAGGGP
jgi:glycosyltransferase involved in cell wall biosynthesis